MRARIGVAVLILTICLLAAVIIPAILRTREQARLTQTRNNLKQVVLGLQLHNDAIGSLPPGATIDSDGQALHGWFSRLLPYMIASDLYSRINFSTAWDDPENLRLFAQEYPCALDPSVPFRFTKDGYALLHFMGNPAFFYRDSHVKLKDIQGGTAHAWLLGEVTEGFQPWGYPFNWRPWNGTLNQSPTGFGRLTHAESIFGMADGSVRTIKNPEALEFFKYDSHSLPAPPLEAMAAPNRTFQCQETGGSSVLILLSSGMDVRIDTNPDGTLISAEIRSASKFARDKHTLQDLQAIVANCPHAQIVIISLRFRLAEAQLLSELSDLEYLQADSIDPRPEVAEPLLKLPHLKAVTVRNMSGNALGELRRMLADKGIRVRVFTL